MTRNNHRRSRPASVLSHFSVASFSLLTAVVLSLSACDDETTTYVYEYEPEPEPFSGYQHEISLNQAFISTADIQRSITLVGDRHYGEGEGNATLRFDIVDDPAEANARFTCLSFMFDEAVAREIDAAERAADAKGTTFRLPLIPESSGYLRIESLENGPDLNELMNIRGSEDKSFRRVHLGFWSQGNSDQDLLRYRSSEVIFQAANRGETVQDALNSAYSFVDMFVANSDELYVRLYEESEVETNPETTTEIYD